LYRAGKQKIGKRPRLADRAITVAARLGMVLGLVSFVGCGSEYRPVVSAINPVGPAEQPQKFAVAIATTGASTPGVVNIDDVSGDTVLDVTQIGANPQYLVLNNGGTSAYSINGDGTFNEFAVSTTLIASQISELTLPAGALPNTVLSSGVYEYVTEPGLSSVATLQTSTSVPTVRQQLSVGANPVYVVGTSSTPRVYALSTGTTPGQAASIEASSVSISNVLPMGRNPVFGIMSADSKRAYVTNKGDGTISVINVQTNQLDTFNDPTTNLSTSLIHDPAAAAPIWADFAPTRNELIVANQGATAGSRGSVSIISIPLCSAITSTSNPTCDTVNPVDAVGFGTVLANIPVGINPIMVAVLQDGTQAFVANAGSATDPGSVTVINLSTNTVVATIPAAADTACAPTAPTLTHPLLVCGHPTWIAVTTGTPTGKAYVVSSDSVNMTVLRSDLDVVTTQIPLSGFGVSVRTNLP